MRKNKRDAQADKAALKKQRADRIESAGKGILTRAEALKVVANTSDPHVLEVFQKHPNKHITHAVWYKTEAEYRAAWNAARFLKGFSPFGDWIKERVVQAAQVKSLVKGLKALSLPS